MFALALCRVTLQWGNPLDFWNQLLQLQKGFLEDSLKQSGFSAATAYMIVRECEPGKINAACTGMAGPEPLPLHLWDRTLLLGAVTAAAFGIAKLRRTQL